MDKGRLGDCNRSSSDFFSSNDDSFDNFSSTASELISNENLTSSSLLKLKLNGILKDNKISEEMHKAFKGRYGEAIKEKASCRILQQLLPNTCKNIICEIYNELKDNLSGYLTDIYSNYFLQKLYCNLEIPIYSWQHENSRFDFLETVLKDFIKVACNSVGTFILQKLIDSFVSPIEHEIVCNCISNLPASTILMVANVR